MKPTEVQIKKFWEWCGISKSRTGYWYYPDYCARPNAPDLDLNNLFKWAVPKLTMYELNSYNNDGLHSAWVSLSEDGGWEASECETPALALFWAIYKVIEND